MYNGTGMAGAEAGAGIRGKDGVPVPSSTTVGVSSGPNIMLEQCAKAKVRVPHSEETVWTAGGLGPGWR